MEDIFHGRQVPIPRSAEARLALRSMMAAYARSHPEKALIDCSIQFSCSLPWAYRADLLHDYARLPQLRAILEENAVFRAAREGGLK